MNISKIFEAKIKTGEEEVDVYAPEQVYYPPMRLNEDQVEERGWVVPM